MSRSRAPNEVEEPYRAIFEAAPEPIWVEDFSEVRRALDELRARGVADLGEYLREHPEFVQETVQKIRVLDVNEAAMSFYGAASKAELLQSLEQLFTEEAYEVYLQELSALARGDREFRAEVATRTLRGEERDVLISVRFPADAAAYRQLLVTVTDITDRKRLERQLQESRQSFVSIVDKNAEGIMVVAGDGVVRFANPAACALLGRRREEFEGSVFELATEVGEVAELDVVREDGQPGTAEMRILDTDWQGGRARLVMLRDITESKRIEEALRESQERYRTMALHDPLTELPNRTLFYDRLRQAIASSTRSRHKMALLFIDLDRFKDINDTLGHDTGDLLLAQLAERLKGSTRECDTAARLGGDEFAVVQGGMNNVTDAAVLARRLLEIIGEPFQVEGRTLHTTASIGITIFPDDTTEPEQLLKNADLAMFSAKAAGPNRYHYFLPEMNERVQEQKALEEDLRVALVQKQFVLFFQPIVELSSRRVVAAEALLRWHHPLRGLVGAEVFVPVAEACGLFEHLGRWVLREALEQASRWSTEFPDLRVSVNLSAAQLQRENVVRYLYDIAVACELDLRLVEVEITESTLMSNPEAGLENLRTLRELGVRVAIDDFGTGYSSLHYLKRFPIDSLKIDQTFIHEVDSDPDDAAIVRALIGLGHSLKLRVVAEGVERPSQLEFLVGEGCDEVQGFLYSEPLPARDFRGWLTRTVLDEGLLTRPSRSE